MKLDHKVSYIWKYTNEKFTIEYSFAPDLDSGDTLNTCDVTIVDDSGTDQTSSMISSVSVDSPKVYFDIDAGTADTSYTIKIVGVTTNLSTITYYLACEVFGSITLNSYIGDNDANSYVTLDEASKYIRNRYKHTDLWDTLTDEGKKRLLIEAAKNIDSYNYIGDRYYDSQALEFPRDDHEVVTGNPATPITATSFYNDSLYSTSYGEYPNDYWKYGTCHITTGTPVNDIVSIQSSNATNGKIVTEQFSATPTINTEFIIFAPIDADIKAAQCEEALFLLQNADMEDIIGYRDIGSEYLKIGDVSVSFGGGNQNKLVVSPKAKKLMSRWMRKRLRYGRA